MSRPPVRILHLYPEVMNIYGDMGNVIALRKRLEWRGYQVHYERLGPGQDLDLAGVDIVFGGGGQDVGQERIAADLGRHRAALRDAAARGSVMLVVCGMFQLFGHRFVTAGGTEIPGVSVLDLETIAGSRRLIGNVVLRSSWGRIVGFENHSGRTIRAPGLPPLGVVEKGFGNDGVSREEGAVFRNVFGTYLHGSLLPKNPRLADELLGRALSRRAGEPVTLEPLDDHLEDAAAAVAASRPQ